MLLIFMHINSNICVQEQYQLILKNKSKFNTHELKSISLLTVETSKFSEVDLIEHPVEFSQSIMLSTFYKCCRPAYQLLEWEEDVNRVEQPITAIVAFCELSDKFYSVDCKIATWVQSGGTRLLPIKSVADKEKIAQVIKNTHALVIPEFYGVAQQSFFQTIAEILKQNMQFPVLALGNSALLLMSYLNDCIELRKRIKLDVKFHNAEMSAFFSHNDTLSKDLDLKTRLQIENKAKLISTSTSLPFILFNDCGLGKRINVIGIGKVKIDEWSIIAAKESLVYYLFIDPKQQASNMSAVSAGLKFIVNFLENVRKRQKKVQEKYPQLGQFKVIFQDERFVYNVDCKLPKV